MFAHIATGPRLFYRGSIMMAFIQWWLLPNRRTDWPTSSVVGESWRFVSSGLDSYFMMKTAYYFPKKENLASARNTLRLHTWLTPVQWTFSTRMLSTACHEKMSKFWEKKFSISEDSEQPVYIRRLFWVFTDRRILKTGSSSVWFKFSIDDK